FQRAVAHPALEAPMAGLVRRVSFWQVGPLRSRAQNSQNAARAPRGCCATDGCGHLRDGADPRETVRAPSIGRPSRPSLLHPPVGCSFSPMYEMTSRNITADL